MSYNREVSWEFLCKTMLLDEKEGDKESSCLFSALNWIVIRFDTWTCHVGFFLSRFLKYGLKKKIFIFKVYIVAQSLSHVWLFAIPWTAARQASPSFTVSWSLLKLMSVESVMPSNYLILCHPFSCPQSFPASGFLFFFVFFPKSQLFAIGAQSIGTSVSASILPMNIQSWFLLGLTDLS